MKYFRGFHWFYEKFDEEIISKEMTLSDVKDIKTFLKWFLNI